MSRDYVALKAAHRKRAQQSGQGGAPGEGAGRTDPGRGKASGAGGAAGRGVAIGMVVGLGNPGEEYDDTRHNVGFAVVDELARRLGASYWKSRPGALVAEVEWPRVAGAAVRLPNGAPDASAKSGPARVVLVKPQSYMNVSGGPVAHLAREYGVPAQGILVAHDDLEVEAGRVRVRLGGGHAGHNGLRSICDKLGTHDFGRLRVGIGRPPGRMAPADFVLRKVRGREAEELAVTVADAAEAALFAIEHGLGQACARYA
jgi:PTH1 family peptidyl-tRNA hydrolase